MWITYGGYNYGIIGTLISILVWVLIIVAVIEIIRAIAANGHHYTPPQPQVPPTVRPATPLEKGPLEILKERYAKGEINKEEFDQKRADINGIL